MIMKYLLFRMKGNQSLEIFSSKQLWELVPDILSQESSYAWIFKYYGKSYIQNRLLVLKRYKLTHINSRRFFKLKHNLWYMIELCLCGMKYIQLFVIQAMKSFLHLWNYALVILIQEYLL